MISTSSLGIHPQSTKPKYMQLNSTYYGGNVQEISHDILQPCQPKGAGNEGEASRDKPYAVYFSLLSYV